MNAFKAWPADNTRLFQSFTAVAGTLWIRLPANLQASISLSVAFKPPQEA